MAQRHLCENLEVSGGLLLLVTLVISILLGIVPLAGIAWILIAGAVTTVDGLFMSLILLTLSGVFFFNAFLDLRDRGLLVRQRNKVQPPSSKTG